VTQPEFPFAAIVGLERSRHALMLLAVDPGLKGVLIAAPPGTGKTLLARSFGSILPMTGPGSGHRPVTTDPRPLPLLSLKTENRKLKTVFPHRPLPIVEVPIGVTEDMLLGGIDFASTLAQGSKRASPGLLARANGGSVCADHIDLLDSVNLRHLLTALDCGYVAIERDGISSRHEARFALIATLETFNSETAPALRDRVGLIVHKYEPPSEPERAEIIHRDQRLRRDPARFYKDFAVQTVKLSLDVLIAGSRLSSIHVDRSYVSRLCSAALDLGVESSRADLFAVRAARANAAIRGVFEVEEPDLIAAIEYVLLPRAASGVEQQAVTSQPRTGADDGVPRDRQESQGRGRGEAANQKDNIQEVIVEVADCPAPRQLADSRLAPPSARNKAKARSGRRTEQSGSTHGRYVAAMPAGGHPQGKRIAIDATLRAAAPHQRIRRAAAASPIGSSLTPGAAGVQPAPKPPGRRPPRPARNLKGHTDEPRVIIKADDLRVKKLKHRSGSLFIFLVDTSGSMALGRIGHAKGVMIRMLRQAYLHRDRVALIAFRGTTVQVVLEPTSSLELARRAIESMPAGGGTPLAAGLAGAISLAKRTGNKTAGQTVLLVFTDGRVNVALQPMASLGRAERDAVIRTELAMIGQQLREHDITPIVIDTGTGAWEPKGGRCASISEAIGAKYCRLPRSGPEALYEQIMRE
jgi:magnesium chelatase subunit D